MNPKYTLTEVALVLLFLLIALAVMIPNAVESHASGTEAAAATALKSGLLPAEVQFQAGAYVTHRNDGLGAYATATALGPGRTYPTLAGKISIPTGEKLQLLPDTFATATPVIYGYRFDDPISAPISVSTATSPIPSAPLDATAAEEAHDHLIEQETWALVIRPIDAAHGTHLFAINQTFTPVMSNPDPHAAASTILPTDPNCFGADLKAIPNPKTWQRFPYPY